MIKYNLISKKVIGVIVSSVLLLSIFFYVKPEGVFEHIKEFPWHVLALVFVLMVINIFIVVYRYYRILIHFGFNLLWWPVFKASIVANIASLVVIPLMGQMIGRQTILRSAGISTVENAAIVAYERVLVGLLSAGLALLGGFYLLGNHIGGYVKQFPLWEIVTIIVLASIFSFLVGISAFERAVVRTLLTKKNLLRIVELSIITLASLAVMLSCFALLFSVVAPSVDFLVLLSAAAVVSFAAGLPISFGGWGLREIASIYILGLFGVLSDPALAASILCGVLSIFSVLVFGPFVLFGNKNVLKKNSSMSNKSQKILISVRDRLTTESIAAWAICLAVAVLVFFQVYISFDGNVINVNLADPFAILALSVLLLNFIINKKVPLWSVRNLNYALLFMSLALIFGYLHGWFVIGFSGWAVGKVFGWFVLLGYMGAGYLCCSYQGHRGFRRIVEIMVVVLCSIIILNSLFILLHHFDVPLGRSFSRNFDGYAGNRNAFAFQILMVLSTFIAYLRNYSNSRINNAFGVSYYKLVSIALMIMIAGMVLTASRTGIATMCILFMMAIWFQKRDRKLLCWAIFYGLMLWAVLAYLPKIILFIQYLYSMLMGLDFNPSRMKLIQSPFSTGDSDAGRWLLIKESTAIWLDSVFIGKGLGYFLHSSPSLIGFPVIIHSTILWLLAEFGVLGFAPFGFALFMIAKWAIRQMKAKPQAYAAVLLLICFVLMSLFHEVLYQRTFWFVLGALLTFKSVYSNRKDDFS